MKISPDLFIKGFYIVSVPADRSVRLMNYCQKKNISLSELKKVDSREKTFIISHRDYKILREFLEKAQIECSILADKGLPVLLSRRPTQLFLALMLLLGLSLIVTSRYIWNITVTGSTYYTNEQIKAWLSENAVPIGSKKEDIICSMLEYSIREGLRQVEWVSCSIDGTTLVVDIYDSESQNDSNPDSTETDSGYSDIISDTDCIITDIIPVSGTAMVSVGDEVKKGDILISGEITIYNDYGEEVDTAYVDAIGYVTGMVTEEFNQSIAGKRQEKVYAEGFKAFGVGFGDAYVNILSPKITAQYDTETEQKKFAITDSFCLPVSIAVYSIHPYSVEELAGDGQELKEIMSKRLSAYISDLRKKGVEIVENNVKMYLSEDGCTAKGSILYKKNIGHKGE